MQILLIAGDLDLRQLVCDPSMLGQYLIVPPAANVSSISAALCAINASLIPNITDKIQQQLDIIKLFNLVSG